MALVVWSKACVDILARSQQRGNWNCRDRKSGFLVALFANLAAVPIVGQKNKFYISPD